MINYLWLLENNDVDELDLDHASGFVISARNAKNARSIASSNAKDEGPALWMDRERSICRKIGIAFSPKEKVIITDMPGF